MLKENEALLALVKRGFGALPASTYAAIDKKWRGSELGPRVDPALVAWIGGGAAAVVALLLGIAWSLRARVARATAELREKVLLLEESQAKNRAFIAALPDYFFTFDREGRYLDFSAARPELLAMPPEAFLGRKMSELGLPETAVAQFMDRLAEAFSRRCMTFLEYRLDTPEGARLFEGRIVPLGEDKALLVSRDITESKRRDEQIRASLREKEILLKEIHHRVKNNMQVISSLIQLQSYTLESERDRELLAETQSRIRAMAQLHELLYRSPDLASIDAAEYLRSVVEELALGHDAPGLRFAAEPIRLGLDEAVPLGLIANELLLNAIKYAYPEGTRGPIEAKLSRKGGDLVLRVSDEGRGLKPGADPATSASMGFTIVRSLAAQLRAGLVFGGPPGFSAELRFPVAPPAEQA
ncbi:MAG: PAS domain-containing protein [Spirochaetaceae bacterium]|nr:PAS domain-containing protein [Spirochaetaceae bacterium]